MSTHTAGAVVIHACRVASEKDEFRRISGEYRRYQSLPDTGDRVFNMVGVLMWPHDEFRYLHECGSGTQV